jgi:hypothetical protein
VIAVEWGVRLFVAVLLLVAGLALGVKAWRERRDLRSLRRHRDAFTPGVKR